MNIWPDFFLTRDFVVGYCGVILLSLVVFLWHLQRQTRKLKARLRDARNALPEESDGGPESVTRQRKEFAEGFEEHDRRFSEDFGLAWKEFVETLILPAPETDDPIRNTREVSRDLNDQTIVFPDLSSGWHVSVPNLLTGVGILGTFVGLAAGVGAASSGLTSGDTDIITSSLLQLLDGASLAFWTSIVGIIASLVFLIWERVVSRQCHMALDKWVMALESCLLRVTMEDLALQSLQQAKQTTSQLTKFNTDLIFSIEQALEEKIAGRLAPQLDQILEAFKGFRADRSADSTAVIGDAIEQFTAALHEKAGAQFDELDGTVKTLDETLTSAAERLGNATQQSETVLAGMGQFVEQIQDLRSAIQRTHEEIAAIARPVEQAARELRESGSEVTAALQEATGLVSRLEASSAALQKHGQETAEAWARYQDRFEGIDRSLGEVFEQMDTGLARYCDEVRKFANELDKTTATVFSSLHQQRSSWTSPSRI